MDEYKYKLVVFPEDKTQLISIEIVPSHWIAWNEIEKNLKCYYMSASMLSKKRKDLQSMVKQGAPPDTRWSKYEVEIRGRAKSYEDAKIGIKKLETKQYAYSTDDEIACQKKMLQEKKIYQMKKSSIDASIIKESLDDFHVDLTKENATENVCTYDRGNFFLIFFFVLLFLKNYPKCRINFSFLGLDKNSTKSLLCDKKYKNKRKCLSQRSEINEMSFQHSLPFDGSCDFDDRSDKSTTQHKIKTTGKGSKRSSSQKLSNHSSKSKKVSQQSSSIEHLSNPNKNKTGKANKNSLKLRENDRHLSTSKSFTFSCEKRNLSDTHRDTHLERYPISSSFCDVTKSKNKNKENETNEPNDGKHSYSPLQDINKNNISCSFTSSSRRTYNSSKFSDSLQPSNSYQTNDEENVDRNNFSFSSKQYMETQKNVQPNINSRKSLSPSLNHNELLLTDSMSSSNSSHSYSSRGRSPRGNGSRDNVSEKLHEIGLSKEKPRIISQSEKTDSRLFQSSQRDSHLCTINEHEIEHEQGNLIYFFSLYKSYSESNEYKN